MSTFEVDQIIDQIRKGRTEPFEKIVRAYQNDIWRIASFGFNDRQTAEDIVQQVFVNAYFKLDQYEQGRDFSAWLRTIARNLVREELRRRQRHARRLKIYQERLITRFADNTKADEYEERLRDALKGCRDKLSDSAGQALDLRYTQSMGFQEIAAKLGRTVAATRQMLGRIRLTLHNCIKERTA